MKPKPLIATICTILMLVNPEVRAEEEVRLMVNELKVFPVYKLERVAVGDPKIADVSILSEREVMLIGKGQGTTGLIIWDESGKRPFKIAVGKKDLEKIAQRIRALFVSSDIHRVKVTAEEENIYVIGEVLSQRELDKIKDILTPFSNVVNLVKQKERQPLVEIDVQVLEIAYDDLNRLGLSWTSLLPITYTEPSETRTPGSAYDPKGHITGKVPKLWRVFKWDRSTINAKLNFLIQDNKARTLANPKLVTLSGKEASFLVGGEVPYVTVETEGRTSVQWKDYGVNLKINPLVTAKDEINTQIEAEVTDLDWANAVTHQGYSIPAVKKREVQTELFLNQGDTIFLAGLIKNEDSRNVDRLPWLSKVPILGELFKSTAFTDKRTELVISISPKIIGEKADPKYFARGMTEEEAILAGQQQFSVYSEEDSPLAYYSQMIEDIITHAVVYPAEAKEANIEGIVKIALCLSSDGRLTEARIKQSSGFKALDGAALGAVQGAAPYPAFPSQIGRQELRLTIPVVFKRYVRNE